MKVEFLNGHVSACIRKTSFMLNVLTKMPELIAGYQIRWVFTVYSFIDLTNILCYNAILNVCGLNLVNCTDWYVYILVNTVQSFDRFRCTFSRSYGIL